mmetsp:Transcript_7252/g.18589  ORF Transcript_7252/g.18589 Transcript_7252/m.18589 type:complete len:226 (-) Transcript_7252:1506-2183(-)
MPAPRSPTGQCKSHLTTSSVTSMLSSMRCEMQKSSTCSRLRLPIEPPCSMVEVPRRRDPGRDGSSPARPPGAHSRMTTASASLAVRTVLTDTPFERRRSRIAAPRRSSSTATSAPSAPGPPAQAGGCVRARKSSSSGEMSAFGVATSPGPDAVAVRARSIASTRALSLRSSARPSPPASGMHTTTAAARGAPVSPYATMCEMSLRSRALTRSQSTASDASCSAWS